MSRLTQVFADLQSDKRRALIPYVVAGDPSPEGTVSLLHSLVDAGADILELGVPFPTRCQRGRSFRRVMSVRSAMA
ncbi:MAG: hypothetical protein CM15mP89_5630 [Gammaproteobacteria bacterium]|nr:MAG: hypothetical protein CM15mP89_5630 [Gammaproteobacteria bacterium]